MTYWGTENGNAEGMENTNERLDLIDSVLHRIERKYAQDAVVNVTLLVQSLKSSLPQSACTCAS